MRCRQSAPHVTILCGAGLGVDPALAAASAGMVAGGYPAAAGQPLCLGVSRQWHDDKCLVPCFQAQLLCMSPCTGTHQAQHTAHVHSTGQLEDARGVLEASLSDHAA